MEQNSSLFSLTIDPLTKAHLAETAKWARFLAIVGFVFLLLLILVGVYSAFTLNRFEESYRELGGGVSDGITSSAGTGMAVVYTIMAVIWFFPLLFTFRFANQMRNALQGNNQELLTTAFQNLKVCFRYLGIVTVIFLVMIALSLLFGIMGLALS
ncbi:MAG: hypothetical protein EOO14_12315 [Chitinophagaceae bacterium]|nr:MAG: hypothetical protein EOO14_12315 [Chitinophagaceae bacterium]